MRMGTPEFERTASLPWHLGRFLLPKRDGGGANRREAVS
jgi:hypothetical protein